MHIYELKIIYLANNLSNSLVQAFAQSLVSTTVRPDCSGLYPSGPENFQRWELDSLSEQYDKWTSSPLLDHPLGVKGFNLI